MALDIDYVEGQRAIDELESLLCNVKRGKRKEVSKDIQDFVIKICKKYNYNGDLSRNRKDID